MGLVATLGERINLSRIAGYTVTFIYPWTGREGHENPHNWDNIVGSHGSTPQALAYTKLLPQFAELGTGVFGLSSMRTAWQKDFATNNLLQFPLLSDEQEFFANALALQWLRAGARQFLSRRTLICFNGVVVMDRRTIPHPEDDAGQTLALLRVLMKR